MKTSGRIQLHDPKSRNYPATATLVEGKPVRHAFNTQNLDQFYTSGCVGFSGTNLLNTGLAMKSRMKYNQVTHAGGDTRRYLTNDDGLTNYHNATLNDPFDWTYPPTDEGSSAIGLMKAWKNQGIITEYRWAFTFEDFLAALQQQPILVGTDWYDSMNTPNRHGIIYPSGKPVGGHEYLATAINWRQHLIGFENSWGENWGLSGRFFMSFHAVETLLAAGGDAAVPALL